MKCNFICFSCTLVTNQATSNTKAAVRRLNSTHVSALADQPDITLDKLHKITKVNLIDAKNVKKYKTKFC